VQKNPSISRAKIVARVYGDSADLIRGPMPLHESWSAQIIGQDYFLTLGGFPLGRKARSLSLPGHAA
jgi:hypothetical protein